MVIYIIISVGSKVNVTIRNFAENDSLTIRKIR